MSCSVIGQKCTDGPSGGQDGSDEEDKYIVGGEEIRGCEATNEVGQHPQSGYQPRAARQTQIYKHSQDSRW